MKCAVPAKAVYIVIDVHAITNYNAYMTHFSQLTIRGVDPATKKLLVQKAAKKGQSINAFALDVLRSSVGSTPATERLQKMTQFLHNNHLHASDVAAVDAAVRVLDNQSTNKQYRDETGN